MLKNHVKKICLSMLILSLIATFGCSNEKALAEQTIMKEKGKPEVKAAQAELRDFRSVIEATGTLVPARHAKLTTLVGGKLEDIRVDIGNSVKVGEILFQVRAVDYELALQQADASLKRAEIMVKDRKREMTRIENLFQGGSATEQMRDQAITSYEDATSALNQAVATRDTAEQSLKDCTVKAPYAGVITAKYMQQGEFAKPGTQVVEIMDLSTLNAEVAVSERYAGKIGQGTSVSISPSSGTTPVMGIIVATNPKIDPAGRTFLVKVAVDNTDGNLQAGLFCTARFSLPVYKQQIAIPKAALSRDRGKSNVWIIKDGKAYKEEVADNGIYEGWVWITEGIEEGQYVVTEGAGSLIQGVEVEVKK